jgi:hypothetical protein
VNYDLIDPQTIVDKIRSECPAYADVLVALTSAQITDDGSGNAEFRSPAAFVLEPVESPYGSPDGAGGRLLQMSRLEIGVMTAVRADRDILGADAAAEMRAARAQLRVAMRGWLLCGPQALPMQLGTSRPFGVHKATASLWFIDSFLLTRRQTSP